MSGKETEAAKKVEDEATPNPEVETPTPEAAKYSQKDVDDFLAEKAKTIVDLESQVKGIRKLQSESAQEVNRLRTQPQSSGMMEALEAVIKAMPQKTDEMGNAVANPAIKQAQQRLTYLKQQEVAKKRVDFLEVEKQKMHQEITDAGLDPNSAEFDTVEDAFDLQNVQAARRRLDRALKMHKGGKEQKVAEEKKPKTEEEIRADERAKVVKEWTKQDNGSPSAAGTRSFTAEQIGKMPYKEWVDAGKPRATK